MSSGVEKRGKRRWGLGTFMWIKRNTQVISSLLLALFPSMREQIQRSTSASTSHEIPLVWTPRIFRVAHICSWSSFKVSLFIWSVRVIGAERRRHRKCQPAAIPKSLRVTFFSSSSSPRAPQKVIPCFSSLLLSPTFPICPFLAFLLAFLNCTARLLGAESVRQKERTKNYIHNEQKTRVFSTNIRRIQWMLGVYLPFSSMAAALDGSEPRPLWRSLFMVLVNLSRVCSGRSLLK